MVLFFHLLKSHQIPTTSLACVKNLWWRHGVMVLVVFEHKQLAVIKEGRQTDSHVFHPVAHFDSSSSSLWSIYERLRCLFVCLSVCLISLTGRWSASFVYTRRQSESLNTLHYIVRMLLHTALHCTHAAIYCTALHPCCYILHCIAPMLLYTALHIIARMLLYTAETTFRAFQAAPIYPKTSNTFCLKYVIN